ncbi:DUF1616 domain-containing protein [Chloroflexota bacterium]
MLLDNRKILLIIVVSTLITLPVVVYTSGILRVTLSLVVIMFFPGYSLLSALFPDNNRLDMLPRLVLSLGLSLILVPLIGLLLNYSIWGIKLLPILITVTFFVVITSAISWYRQRRKLTVEELPSIKINIRLPSRWYQLTRIDRALSIALVCAVVVALGTFIYAVATPDRGETFTEFYITDINGTTENYPAQILSGEAVELMASVVNHEGRDSSYRVTVNIDGVLNNAFTTGLLAEGQRWQETVSVVPQHTGQLQRLEFWLYEKGSSQPYNKSPLYIYVDVSPQRTQNKD